ncbi:MAG: metal ABC transporter permease [Chthoniobacteraceae bacterium]
MLWPLVACVILPPLLVYLGLHVVQRGIIFIDIAMAQMASLGFCVGVLLHLPLEGPVTIAIALGFTLVGAALFSFTNKSGSEVPQEATIGIAYVVAAATAILLLSRAAEGDEEIKNMLVGNILLVSAEDLLCVGSFLGKFLPAMKILNEPGTGGIHSEFLPGTAWWFAFVGLVHLVFRRKLCGVSFSREQSHSQGLRVRAWDFLFYALFGLVVTSFVRIAGVLLVFSYLIVPAVCAVLLVRRIGMRLIVGCIVALIGGVGGLFWSFYEDLPTGAAIVCALGILLVATAIIAPLIRRKIRAGDAAP